MIHPTAKVFERVNRKYPLESRNTILQPSITYTVPVPLPHCQHATTIEISTSGIAVVSMQQGYSRQRRTIGSFSATADLLVV